MELIIERDDLLNILAAHVHALGARIAEETGLSVGETRMPTFSVYDKVTIMFVEPTVADKAEKTNDAV